MQYRNRVRFIALLAVMLGSGLKLSQAQFATVHGTVSTRGGEKAENFHVQVLDSKTKQQIIDKRADLNGAYRIERLLPGTYDFLGCDSGKYKPDVKRGISVKENERSSLNFILGLQSSLGGLQGKTQDPQGPIVNASISVYAREKSSGCEERLTATNSNGEYTFSDLAPGEYEVYTDYTRSTPQAVTVTPEQVQLANITLDSSIRVKILEDIQVADLPRTTTIYALLSASSVSGIEFEGSSVVNGSRPGVGGFIVDSENADPTPRLWPTYSISFPVSTDRDLAANRGTNAFHGSVGYSLGNDALDARSFFSLPDFNTFRKH